MSKKEKWFRGYVANLLGEIWDNPHLVTDGDGDWPFRSEYGACWVQVETCCDPWVVTVFSHAAVEVPKSAKVIREVSELNKSARFVKVVWADGLVVVRNTATASSLDRATLQHLLDSVSSVTDEIGPMIATVYGGETPFTPNEVGHEA